VIYYKKEAAVKAARVRAVAAVNLIDLNIKK
jgi:hypothetical protein